MDIDKLEFPNIGNNKFYSKEFSVGQMLPQVPLDESGGLYRVTYDNEGIYQYVRKHCGIDGWKKFLSNKCNEWLPKPPSYAKDNISYFTKDGYTKFNSDVLPIMGDYINKYGDKKWNISNVKVTKHNIPDDKNISYKDKYQIVTGNNVINESALKSNIDKDYKSKGNKSLSSFTKKSIKEVDKMLLLSSIELPSLSD